MGDARYARCKGCGKKRDEGVELSWTRLCPDCSVTRAEASVMQMHKRSGPYFDRWRRGMAASVGGVLLDNAAPNRDDAA